MYISLVSEQHTIKSLKESKWLYTNQYYPLYIQSFYPRYKKIVEKEGHNSHVGGVPALFDFFLCVVCLFFNVHLFIPVPEIFSGHFTGGL